MIPVKYIGPDAFWHGLLYDTRLRFEAGQTLQLPAGLALKFLTHRDTFERGEEAPQQQTAQQEADAALAEAEKQRLKEEQTKTETFELFDQIDLMDKAALATFSQKYGQVLDKRKGLDALRAEVKGFVDRFGAL